MNRKLIAAVDVGGTKIAAGLVDFEGRVVSRLDCPTAPELGYPAALARMAALLRTLRDTHGTGLAGIGVGSAGPIDPETGVYGEVGTLPGWKGAALGPDLAREFSAGFAVENDADAAALGEARWGAGCGSSSMLYVTVSTGIGVGAIFGGRLYRGAGGAHPEIGHQILDSAGPLCYCGANGCWEGLAAGPAMEAWYRAQLPPDAPPEGAASAARICELARQGEPLALRAVEREAHFLGLGLANLITIFCPERIVLGGGMMRSADLLLEPALAMVRRFCTQVPLENTSIVLAGLGADAGLLGAACVWLHRSGQLS